MKSKAAVLIVIGLSISVCHSQEKLSSPSRPKTVSAVLHYYADNESDLQTDFGFNSQDVALQWFTAPTDGLIKTFWWKNGTSQGDIKKGTIRAWRVDPKVLDIPNNAVDNAGRMGYYLDTAAGSIPTPFKPYPDAKYLCATDADTQRVAFDPLQTEAEWLPGGLQVSLDSTKWQGINLLDTGNPFYVKAGEIIGFTLSNDSHFETGNSMMRIYSRLASTFDSAKTIQPFHSMKFYAKQYTQATPVGWRVRAYDWGMYVQMDCTTDGPALTYQFRNDPKSGDNTIRKISAIIQGTSRPAEPARIKNVVLKYKLGTTPYYESIPMSASLDTFAALVSGVQAGAKMQLYVAVIDSAGRRFLSELQSYTITSIATNGAESLDRFRIYQNHPNPFNPSTNISYSVPELTNVRIVVFDQLGREIQTLVDRKLQAGVYVVRFDGDGLASGLYFYRIQAGNFNQTKKMLLLR